MLRTSSQMHGRRALAVAAAAGLLISLFAPWYRESVVARGLTGLRTLTLTRSGWQAFSSTELLVVIVAVLTLIVALAGPRAESGGEPDRPRLSGATIAALGVITFVVLLVRLSTAPGTSSHSLDDTMVAIRWGIFFALGSSAVLAVAGLRLLRAPRPASERRPRARRERTVRGTGPGRPIRSARPDRAARANRPRLPAAQTDGRGPSEAPAARRPPRPRPPRRADGPRWEEQATSWLDTPD